MQDLSSYEYIPFSLTILTKSMDCKPNFWGPTPSHEASQGQTCCKIGIEGASKDVVSCSESFLDLESLQECQTNIMYY